MNITLSKCFSLASNLGRALSMITSYTPLPPQDMTTTGFKPTMVDVSTSTDSSLDSSFASRATLATAATQVLISTPSRIIHIHVRTFVSMSLFLSAD